MRQGPDESSLQLAIITHPDAVCEWIDASLAMTLSPALDTTLPELLACRYDRAAMQSLTEQLEPQADNVDTWFAEQSLDSDVVTVLDMQIDLEDGACLNKWPMFFVDNEHTLIAIATAESIDTGDARNWHTPSNEREFNRSPQRALW